MVARRAAAGLILIGAALCAGGCPHPPTTANDDSAVPSGSGPALQTVAQGKNEELSFKPKVPGSIWVYDFDSNEFVYQGQLSAGEKFVFEPASSRATINGETIDLTHPSNDRDEYRIYFSPRPGAQAPAAGGSGSTKPASP